MLQSHYFLSCNLKGQIPMLLLFARGMVSFLPCVQLKGQKIKITDKN